MDFIVVLSIVFGYWYFKFRTVETENVNVDSLKDIPIGNNLTLQREPQAFEKIVRELKLIQ